jgi:hypothetical protein
VDTKVLKIQSYYLPIRQIHMQVLRSHKGTHATEQEHTGEHQT